MKFDVIVGGGCATEAVGGDGMKFAFGGGGCATEAVVGGAYC